jgi:hypothetical protein
MYPVGFTHVASHVLRALYEVPCGSVCWSSGYFPNKVELIPHQSKGCLDEGCNGKHGHDFLDVCGEFRRLTPYMSTLVRTSVSGLPHTLKLESMAPFLLLRTCAGAMARQVSPRFPGGDFPSLF